MARTYLSPPDVGCTERQLLLEAFDSNWIAPLGPSVDAFESEIASLVRVPEAAALASGTAGLHLALVLLGVGPGDEVMVSDLTFVASANVVRYVGAVPILIDCDAATWTMDPDLLEEALADSARRGKLPKAVLVVDLYGQCANYERIRSATARWGVPIVQDASESLGATFRSEPAGRQGDIAVFSFNGNKIITTSGGGMLVSKTSELVRRARYLASQAKVPAPHYEHEELGYNYRLSNLLAAVGRGQLMQLASRVAKRREIFERYEGALRALPGCSFMPEAAYGVCTRWLTCITTDPDLAPSPERIRLLLERQDIEARPVWKPMHMQPMYRQCRVYGGSIGAGLFRDGLCLPSGSTLSAADQERITGLIVEGWSRGI